MEATLFRMAGCLCACRGALAARSRPVFGTRSERRRSNIRRPIVERVLSRHQWRQRLGRFALAGRRPLRPFRRAGWRHGWLQLAVRPDCAWGLRRLDVACRAPRRTRLCPGGSCSTSGTWLSTIRGRAGYAFGVASCPASPAVSPGDIRAATPASRCDARNAGWTIGGGVDSPPRQWSAKADTYVDLDNPLIRHRRRMPTNISMREDPAFPRQRAYPSAGASNPRQRNCSAWRRLTTRAGGY